MVCSNCGRSVRNSVANTCDDCEASNQAALECEERAQMQHDIQMTDNPRYADWYRRREAVHDLDENGIDE